MSTFHFHIKRIPCRAYCSRAAIYFTLSMMLLLFAISCKQEKASEPAETEKETNIHKKYERGPATLTLDIDKKEITIAERLNLTIGITVDEDYDVKLPAFGDKLQQFGIVDYRTTRPKLTGDKRKTLERSYVLEPFLSGDYTIPEMKVMFWEKGKQETDVHEIETSEIEIKVKSLLPEDLKEFKIHEIMPPVPLPRSYAPWLWAGIGLAAVLLAGVIIFFIKRKKNGPEATLVKTPAHILAYEALEALVQEDLINQGRIKLFYHRISDIIRRYIENRFGLRAPEQTTEEFLAGLDGARDFPDNYKDLLNNFLRHCDLVKFAAYLPEADNIQNTFDSCKSFIEGTKL